MPDILLEPFEPSPEYLRVVDYALTEASETYRLDIARRLLARAKAARGNLVLRYRFALDALRILDNSKSIVAVKPPVDPRHLTVLRDIVMQVLANCNSEDLASEVRATFAAIEQTTWPNFDALVDSAYFARPLDVSDADGINAFQDWFEVLLPYFSIDLPTKDPSQADDELNARIGHFERKMQSLPKGDPFEWRDRCVDAIRIDARKKWDQRRNAVNG